MAKLYVIGMPINADYRNVPPFTKEILQECDFVIAEERKVALRVLAAMDSRDKECFLLNEHAGENERMDIATEVFNAGSVAFFSDAGTPCVADPDYRFIDLCHSMGIEVISVPGPSSIMAALSVSGFYAERFVYLGFPPRERMDRYKFFKELELATETSVFLERPYALSKVLDEMAKIKKEISVSLNLGMPEEKTVRGLPADLKNALTSQKAPFVVVVNGLYKPQQNAPFKKKKR